MRSEPGGTGSRKVQHLEINLSRDVRSSISTGLDGWRLVPRALPEIALAEVDPGCDFLGYHLSAPVLVSCMTGGAPGAEAINNALAVASATFGFAVGLGSARALLEDPAATAGFMVRGAARGVPLLANLGAIQLTRGVTADACRGLVERLQADALVLHLNALQEALQPGGDTDFRGVLPAIAALCRVAEYPVLVKEVGWGIPPDDVRRLFEAGVAAVDIAGAGGTSWSEVERHRQDGERGAVFDAFRGWGLPTAEALVRARAAVPAGRLIASGGLRDGLDVARVIALGADLAGIAGPFLRSAAAGEAALHGFSQSLVEVLRVAMFATGAARLSDLRTGGRIEQAT